MSEYINHPDHYNQGDIEVIDVIEDWNLGFHLGNAIKYIARAEHKDNTRQDLEKAKWYLQRYIDNYLVEEREEYAEGEKLNI
nr:MAG TPA: nucleotide kinase [Caudoviricetes sp.]